MKYNIKKLREGRGISQGELAQICSVSRQTINAVENDKYDPSLELAFGIANALGTTVDSLFKYRKNKKNKG
ncbi:MULTISPECIES: helix-turn-helix transcriptional regulator [Clostridia]|uniref:helix-turn-helix transcriptional regulator n=1 Tax=Clostridia TaxID=186801 RepID=UPI000EA2C580|nr:MULTISPECIES: helix-turn-helix transcriptional regulator [Clostridia]NBJ71495.1 transcriptional regulator [Roseburia sp. 1XD42-34]RKI74356.1 transcriptional regulator [Clostridium sp. 1xD42-85]